MRKSKYDQSSFPIQDSKNIDMDDNISKIENCVEFDTELMNLANQIEDIKVVIQELRQVKALVVGTISDFEESAQILNSAVKTSDNISDTINRAIIQAENTVINVKLSDEDKSILAEYRNKLIEEEKSLFEKQITELKTLHTNHWKEVRKYVKSDTSFSLNGKIAQCAVVGFWILYAYFCLTLGGLIIYMKFF
jgi:mannose/fructose/N-acetylgalactosamine-specific phosphotransferase system component IIB